MGRKLLETEYGVYKELLHYLQEMEKTPAVDCNEAVKKQALPTSAALGLAPWDLMHELETIPARIKFLNDLYRDVCTNASGVPGPGMQVKVAAFTVWNGNLWGLRRSLLPWMQYHTQLGVCKFYVAFQGRDEATYRALLQLAPLLDMVLISKPFATTAENKAWLEHAARDDWGRRPGNWRLMSKQGYCGNIAFERARRDGMNWMAHIDADELLIPSVSLAAELAAAPAWAGYLKMHNHEAVIESFEVVNKYEEVTLFKTHDQTLPNRTSDIQWRFRLGTYGTFYQVYYNGKSIGRVDRGHIHMWGPHDFLGPRDDRWKDPVHNPEGEWKMAVANFSLLHISYTSWHDLMGKARISCPNEYREAAKAGNVTKVKECFCLDFDLHAYMAATKGEDAAREHWVRESLLSEGAVRKDGTKCHVYKDVDRLKQLLVRDRIYSRVTGPQQLLRAQELAIRHIAAGMGIKLPPLGGQVAAGGGGLTTAAAGAAAAAAAAAAVKPLPVGVAAAGTGGAVAGGAGTGGAAAGGAAAAAGAGTGTGLAGGGMGTGATTVTTATTAAAAAGLGGAGAGAGGAAAGATVAKT
ncbi:hypothetical protein CHLRE_04g218450v5 [Chlamydomonas reinhardtii]|uniref:Glycosyltransferase family 92 protein n=1 Tax=Chlamydomonas reinhardtii TaxID=3055 RepID=A0A2K3DU23_CHLRE|nr:uncharacterized protein CHLRE_04g218450v5 [Chlamydomonas reinhardtii]PNW84033.1 hypothetical protein CHLRE_04g218450v5 [Chlamydomonas reinhardtii]